MNNFPEINIPEAKKNSTWIAEYIDAAIDFHEKSASHREASFDNIYDSYNGVRKSVAKNYLTHRYGKDSQVPFMRYNYGRTKTKVLFGEMLALKFDATIEAMNPNAKSKKMKNRAVMKGAMKVKEELSSIKESFGFNILNGAEVPEQDDPQAEQKIAPRLPLEAFLQMVLDDKMESEKILRKGYEYFVDLVLVSECHGCISTDAHGNDTVIFVPAKNIIGMETQNDPFMDRSPFHGHKEYMYLHQIMTRWPELTADQIQEIKDSRDYNGKDWTLQIGGETAYPVYYVEFFSPRPIYTKISPLKDSKEPYRLKLDPEWYQKNSKKIQKDVEKEKYDIETKWGEQMFKGYRIGATTHLECTKKENVVQRKNGANYRAYSDYIHLLFGTVNGIRVSIQELIYNLDELYDVIMWQIVREIRKMKGTVLVYDEALTPKKGSFSSVMFDMVEEGVVKINSLEEGNYYARDVLNATDLVKQLDLGPGTTLNDLVNMKVTIEKTIDRITGINEEREGLGRASQTATGSMANLEGSRNITKDIYFFLNEFMEKLLLRLLDKVKMNRDYLEKVTTSYKYGDNMIAYSRIIEELPLSEVGLKLTDGKLVEEVKERVRHLFNQEINSGQLRTMDVIQFEVSKTLGEGLQVLEAGWQVSQEAARADRASKEKIAEENRKASMQMAEEDREDRQAHEIELKKLDLQGDAVKLGVKAESDSDKNQVMREKNNNNQ